MSRKIQVVPAILTDDPKALETMVRQAESFADFVQIDVMDGQFVPSCSVKADHVAAASPKFKWEAHIMVKRPEDCLKAFKDAGARRIVFHYEATDSPEEVISRIRGLGLKAGLAINPETTVSAALPVVDHVDCVLFLSVNPGFYGAKFIPEVLDKVAELRKARPGLEIGIDGGIKENNILTVARTGLDYICVGSAIFAQPDPGASFRKLQELVRGV